MIAMTLLDISQVVQGQLIGADNTVTGVGIDTRTLATGSLYVAIAGEQFDGHDFIAQAEAQEALAVLVARPVATSLAQIIVTDTRVALAELAGEIRNRMQIKLCGITGSNGKTTVKEMVAAILAVNYEVLFTQGNFNNDIGVPLTLLNLHKQHQFAVIEMGANHIGEIAYTSQYARPDVAVITNVGAAHIEGFGNLQGVATTKAEIIQSLSADGIAVLNAEDDFFDMWCTLAKPRKVISFGLLKTADVRAEHIATQIDGGHFNTHFELIFEHRRVLINLALAGEHNVRNALAASAACLGLGIGLEQVQAGLKNVKSVKGRLQLCVSESGMMLINDSYNANPASLDAALAVLKNCSGELWLALGAFGELGADSAQMHRVMGKTIKQAGVKRFFATGAMAEYAVNAFGEGGEYFSVQEDLIAALKEQVTKEVVLLVKGSRAQQMERVVNALLDKAIN